METTAVHILDLPAPSLLIGSVLVVSLWGWLFKPVQTWMILIPYRLRGGREIHRLLTAGWVHGGLSHLFFNMLSLYFFAGQTTQVLGSPRFLLLYLTAVVVAFIPSAIRHRNDPRWATLGASGGVAAVMISALLLHPKLKITLFFLPVPVPAAAFAALYLVYSLWHSYSEGDGVNHDAHFSGAVYGALLTYLFEPARVERSIRSLVRFAEAVR